MLKDWIDIVRRVEFYRMASMWSDQNKINDHLFPGVVTRYLEMRPALSINNPYGIITEYSYVYKISQKKHPSYPDFFHISGPGFGRFSGNVSRFKFTSLLFIWGQYKEDQIVFRYPAAKDGFPAVLEMKNVLVHFNSDDCIEDFARAPAFKAGYLTAGWAAPDGMGHRPDGPYTVAYKDYEESWKKGKHKKTYFKKGGPALFWSYDLTVNERMEEFAMGARGNINPLSNQFFEDDDDAFEFMTEFAI